MVWGSMIALSTIASLKADCIFKKIGLILETMKNGTLITEVWGIKTLVKLSINKQKYKTKLLPVLIDYLEKCRPIDFASRVETIIPVLKSSEDKEILSTIIQKKTNELSLSQTKKLKTILNKDGK